MIRSKNVCNDVCVTLFCVYIWRLDGNLRCHLRELLKHADNIVRKLRDLILAITAHFQGKT